MKLLKYAVIFLAFISLTFLGCSDKSRSPVQPKTNNSQVAKPLSKTSGPGAWLVTNSTEFLDVFYDPNTGLALALGVNDISNFCSGGGIDVVDVKQVLLPNADPTLRRDIARINGNIYARIWKVNSNPFSFSLSALCDFFSSVPSTATGNVNVRLNDNDFNLSGNHEAWGISANGTVQGQDGQLYKLALSFRAVYNGTKSNFSRIVDEQIELNPVGN